MAAAASGPSGRDRLMTPFSSLETWALLTLTSSVSQEQIRERSSTVHGSAEIPVFSEKETLW